jgi:hypothetical protein
MRKSSAGGKPLDAIRSAGQRWCQAHRFWLVSSDPVDTAAVGLLGGKLESELLAPHAGKEPTHRVRLPAGGFHDGSDRGPVRPAQQPQHPRLLGIRLTSGDDSALASASLGADFGGGARLDRPRTLALGLVKAPLHAVGATVRRTTQTPRRPNGAGGVRGASQSGSASVTIMHALFTTEVECKMASVRADLFLHSSSAEISPGAANPYHAARTRKVSAAGLGLPGDEVVTEIQSDSSRPDSPVRIRHAQPGSLAGRPWKTNGARSEFDPRRMAASLPAMLLTHRP